MTERERLLDKLEKVRALAERGVGGEKESAERTLAALMERYGITEEDLEDSKTSTHWIRYKTKWEEKLLYQLAYMYLGIGHAFGCVGTYTGRTRKKVGIECTQAQFIEIEADFAFYSAAMEEEMGLFYQAFLQKNNLFPPPELAREMTEEEEKAGMDLERIAKLQAMMGGLDRHTTQGTGGRRIGGQHGLYEKEKRSGDQKRVFQAGHTARSGETTGVAGGGNRLFYRPRLHKAPPEPPRWADGA